MSEQPKEKPSIREVVAIALRDAAVDKLRSEIKDRTYDLAHMKQVFVEAQRESDRASAILIFALIDDILSEAFQHEINPAIRGGAISLLQHFAPLATADARIQIAAGLFWITKDVYEDLDRVRKIRNVFAHRAKVSTFQMDPIRSHIEQMSQRELMFKENPELSEVWMRIERGDIRLRFLVRSALLACTLLHQLIVAPKARLHQLPWTAVGGYEKAPENIRQILLTMADIVIQLVGITDDKPAASTTAS